jgi:hypothetical protein
VTIFGKVLAANGPGRQPRSFVWEQEATETCYQVVCSRLHRGLTATRPQLGFVDEGGRLQSLAGLLLRHSCSGNAGQFVIDQR